MVARGETVAERVARLEYKMDRLADRTDAYVAELEQKVGILEAFVDAEDAVTDATDEEFEAKLSAYGDARAAIDWKPLPS